MTIKSIIDIGSNTIKLFIADVNDKNIIKPLELKRRMALLGKGINLTNKLSDESMETATQHIQNYLEICKTYNINYKDILFTATAACRNTTNGKYFINKLKNHFNIKYIKILSTQEEAKFTFLGSLESIPTDTKTIYYVVDVGGGSFQVSRGYKNNFLEGSSLQIGCNRLTEEFKLNQKTSAESINNAITYIEKLKSLNLKIQTPNIKALGAGGTIKIIQIMQKDLNNDSPITIDELINLANFIRTLDIEERFQWFKFKYPDDKFRKDAGLTIERAEIILAGICIVIGILKNLALQEIIPCKTDAKDYLIKLTSYDTLFNFEAQE